MNGDQPKPEPDEAASGSEDQLVSRPYQTELEDISVVKNTIIHLPTGSGKTFIAIRLINRFREALKLPWGQGGKRTFFLVNTVPLVGQQKKVIQALCAVKSVAGYSGDDGVDYWDKSKWDKELEKHQVIVMTSQILADMLTHAYIRIDDINLLIFDECHHAVIDHPMRMVMKHFEDCPPERQPRVLGLTATLLNGNVNVPKVESILRELEKTFRATIATSNEMSAVFNYATNPHEVIQYYKTSPPSAAALEAIEVLTELQGLIRKYQVPMPAANRNIHLGEGQKDITNDPKKLVKIVGNMVTHMIEYIKELREYGGALGILAYIVVLERLKRKASNTEEEDLYQLTIVNCTLARAILLNGMLDKTGYEKIVTYSSDKFLRLLKVLKEYSPALKAAAGDVPFVPVPDVYQPGWGAEQWDEDEIIAGINLRRADLSGIIFTKQRFTAKILYNLLKEVKETNPAEFGFINHDFIVGFNVNPTKFTREDYYTRKASQTALLHFGNGDLNCLIATSVIEEGVDIPQCGLVIKYDPPFEYRSYIQSKGRARSCHSSYVLLLNEKEREKFRQQYENYQKVEKHIQRLLVGKTDDREEPTESEMLQLYQEDDIPPYVTEHGTRLLPVSSISLLNRYCLMLPHDQFTNISPMWVQETIQVNGLAMKRIHIYMPVSCPIKEVIKGEPKHQVKTAKRSAAMNACIRLHQEGELDATTMLPIKYGAVNFDDEAVKNCFPNWKIEVIADGSPKPGTKKMVRKHEKVFPKYLNRPPDTDPADQKFYLHVIQMRTCFAPTTDSRDVACYDMLQRDECYGFLTHNPLPKLCAFPMYLAVGEVETKIKVNYAVIDHINEALFGLIKSFHFLLFDKILQIAKRFVIFDGTKNAMYVVPLNIKNSGYDIDWDVLMTYTDIPPLVVPTEEERKNLQVIPEEYEYHVVSPWYRGTLLPTRYLVSKVMHYMTPESTFDSAAESLMTFEEYYQNKYNLEILGQRDQPLLEVRHLNSRMNCLFPSSNAIQDFSEKQKKLIRTAHGEDPVKGFPELFIPEFVVRYDFPAVLWYKAIMIPCIIHRVTMLLVAYELRTEIIKEVKYGEIMLPRDEQWLPIEVDMKTAMHSMLAQIEDRIPVSAIDRINDPVDDTVPAPKIVSMKESIYQLKKKKINEEYPWQAEQEPIDIERNLMNVTVMDIECYDEFVNAPMVQIVADDEACSPRREPSVAAAAICAAPVMDAATIQILSRVPTGRGPELRDILTAITTIKSHDTFDLERPETLGDSFLKFIASLYLFHKFPRLNEGQLTNIKGRLIGNRNLYYAGERICLPGRMKVEQFSPRSDFLVPSFFAPVLVKRLVGRMQIRPTILMGMHFSTEEILNGSLDEDTLEAVRNKFAEIEDTAEKEPFDSVQNAMQCYFGAQAVPDKAVADCVEALLGTYIQDGGIRAGVKVLEFFRILPKEDNVISMLKRKVPTALTESKTSLQEVYRVLNNCHDDVEQIMHYKFKDPALLLEALSHPSYIRNRISCGYERMEFLGDAILDFLVTAHIYENGQDLKPGDLTDLRSALVNNVTFASYVVKLGLHKCILTQLNMALDNAIIAFVEHQERRNHSIEEDVLHLIDEEDCQLAEYVEVPKVLSDVFESLAAAIFLDTGGDLETVWSVYYRIMKEEIAKFSQRIPKQPVRLLHENIHACPTFGLPEMINTDLQKMMIPVTFTKFGTRHTVYGVGKNKFEAKRAASKVALKILSL